MGTDKFTYQPLEQPMDFRLLALFPGKGEDGIECSLDHFSLASPPKYAAVSYTWGTPDDSRRIVLNGVYHQIQANLFDFLLQLRSGSTAMTLWVDALCINQSNVLEKNVQVPLMGLIYSRADSVSVWLGPQADSSEQYFDFCNGAFSDSVSIQKRGVENVNSDAALSISAAMASIQRRNYWTRTWIIQELLLANEITIFCGDRSCSWHDFCSPMPDHNAHNQEIGLRNPSHPFGKLRKLRIPATMSTLRQLIFECHKSECSEPRDLIYALLSIAKDTRDNPNSIVVDYSCSLEILFLRTMTWCSLQEYDGVPCLQFCDTLSNRLGLNLEQVLSYAKSPALPKPSKEPLYFAKLTRFGRLIQTCIDENNSSFNPPTSPPGEMKMQLCPIKYTIRKLPGTDSLYSMWSCDAAEATDTIFTLSHEGATIPNQLVACISRPIHYNPDEYGVIPYRVVGMGIIVHQSSDAEEAEPEPDMRVACLLLRDELGSLSGRLITDGIPGYGLEIGLLELIGLCMSTHSRK